MSAIAELPSHVKLGERQVHLNLSWLFARITEVSESGCVPDLSLVNGCDLPVLLLDGEEPVGAKRHRILNLSILAPAQGSLVAPV